ncbi:unnamed protein product [Paramecium octaurelia]|uniref:EGF-like domain-containing protein n=1 Tax=Paramecium octaurelia TaxID=43137 RepID=A0A8S1XH01_PAROT|nr:unnamed protein product [Paramecium octaurelia]
MKYFLLRIELFNLFLLIQFYLVKQNECLYETYENSLLSQEAPQETHYFNSAGMDFSKGNSFSFGFWSQCIPLWNPLSYPRIQGEYRKDLTENGQFLYQIQNGNKISVISYIVFDLQNLKLEHYVSIYNNKNPIYLKFNYPPQDYEGRWIFTFVTIQPQIRKIIIQSDNQGTNISPLEIISNDFMIVLGGRGYTEKKLNLNIFKGRLSKMLLNNIWFFNENMRNSITSTCRIPQISDTEQRVEIVKGFQYFSGYGQIQGNFDQFGNRYCISGWIKIDITQINYYSKMPVIRITAFKNYGSGKNIGDELMKLEIEVNKNTPDKTQYILTNNFYGLPFQSLQSQYPDLNPVLNLNQCCDYYLNGIQQWHFIQYEYGRSQSHDKNLIQIQFSNELGLQSFPTGSNKYQSSFINSKFYYVFGGDYFSNNMLQAWVSDFKFEFNYQDDRQLMNNVCYYSCKTCNGPQQTNCLSCIPDSNRVYIPEENKCLCQQGYIDYDGQVQCMKFEYRFPTISSEFVLNQVKQSCQFGYFLVPENNECIKCPQDSKNDFLCIDCLQFPLTWSEKSICTKDLINYGQTSDSAFKITFKNEKDYDFYFIDGQNQMKLQLGYLDYCDPDRKEFKCVLSREQNQGCKPNYYISNNDCFEINLNCLEAYDNGDCKSCIDNMYPVNNNCYNCPLNCQSCEFNKIDKEVHCTTCFDKYTQQNKGCQPCGSYCQVCQDYYDKNIQYSYLKCLKCVDDTKYYLSFDGVNCQENKIENCQYAFQYLKSDQKTNTLDKYFELQFDQQNIITSCARCVNNSILVVSYQLCLYVNNPSCTFGYAQSLVQCDLQLSNFAYSKTTGDVCTTQQICLITNSTVVDEVQFTESCSEFSQIPQCEICIEGKFSVSDQKKVYKCLSCSNGYYQDQIAGKCFTCPSDLKCLSCYQQQKTAQDNWKVGIRAYYKVFIEKDDEHPYSEYGQSQSQQDYEIKCSQCISGYELMNDLCVKSCSENCLKCQFINGQYICLKCKLGQYGRQLTLMDNQCIECSSNCALCRVRSNEELYQINPLFKNPRYMKYAHQCLKSYSDNGQTYDQQLGMFVNCLDQDLGCFLQYSMNLNLYCSSQEFEKDRDAIVDSFQKQRFQLENILIDDLISGQSFREYENDLFYFQANEKYVKSIRIIISSNISQTCIIPDGSKIQQVFSENIFSAINVELQFNFLHEIQFIYERVFQISNFNSIKISNLKLIPQSSDKLKQLIFISCFPLNVELNNIEFTSESPVTQSQIQFLNVSSLTINTFILNGVILQKSDFFMTIAQTEFKKIIQINDFQLLNSKLNGIKLLNLDLAQNDSFSLQNSIFQGNFYNSSIVKTTENKVIGTAFLNQIQFESDLQECQSIFNLFWFIHLKISNFIIQNSQLFNSSLIELNNNSTLSEILFSKCQLIEQSIGIINSEVLSYINQFFLQITNIKFESNTYEETAKLMKFHKFNFLSSQLQIKNISIINNEMINVSPLFNLRLQESSLIYLSIEEIDINGLNIIRGQGLTDISIIETQFIQIKSAIITQGYEYKLHIHQYLDCQLKYIKGQYYLQSIFIYSCLNLIINDMIIKDVSSNNSPIIQYQSAQLSAVQQSESITISNLFAQNNLLLITEQQSSTSIIKIESVQVTTLQINNFTFINNIMHEYIQDNLKVSALGFNFDCQQASIILMNSKLSNNIVFNSTDSLIMIKGKSLILSDCYFFNNSIFDYSILQPHILWSFSTSDQIYLEDIQKIFQTKSSTGNAQLIVEELKIINCKFKNSQGSYGGALQVIAQNYCRIYLSKLSFKNIMTSFQEENEQGGSIFIDSSASLSLNLTINDIKADTIFSRYQGGFLYLKAGSKNINVEMGNLILNNIHSLQGSIIYIQFQSQSSYSKNIYINNFIIKNFQRELLQFLNKYEEISANQEYALNNNRTLFFIEFGESINFQNVYIENLLYESFLFLSSSRRVNLKDLQIINSKLSNFLILIESNQLGYFQILQNNCSSISNQYQLASNTFQCLVFDSQISAPSKLKMFYDSQSTNDLCWRNLNKNLTDMAESGLILLSQLYDDQIEVKNLHITEINCSLCQRGLLSFKYRTTNKIQKYSSVLNLLIKNSSCGQKGCFNLIKDKQNRLLYQYYEQQKFLLQFESIITNYICENNSCKEGTCLNSENITIYLQDSNFQFNNASLRGGAIYTNSEILMYNCLISNNQANIGGGIFQQESTQYPANYNQIYNNKALNYGTNIISTPQKLSLQLNANGMFSTTRLTNEENLIIDQVYVPPYKTIQGAKSQYLLVPSGQSIANYRYFNWKDRQYIPSNQTFRIIPLNQEDQIIKSLSDTFCRIQGRIHNFSENKTDSENFQYNFTNINYTYFNDSTQDYNWDDLVIYLDNELPSHMSLQLEFSCNSIQIPIFNKVAPYNLQGNHNNYKLRVEVRSLPCQFGEIKSVINFSCILCDNSLGLFSIKQNSPKCEVKDDVSTISVNSSQLNLKQGFWRPFIDTSKVSGCLNLLSNCLGGLIEGDESCSRGHIGALCEQCDLYNTRGDGEFSVGQRFVCGSCQETQRNTLIITLVSFWTLISVFISVQGTIKAAQNIMPDFKFVFHCASYFHQDNSAILMKLLTNYLQILDTISTFQIDFSDEVQGTLQTISSPFESMIYSLDCFLSNAFAYDIHYARMIWELITPFFYTGFFFFIYFVAFKFGYAIFNKSVITTTLIYMYIYLQPTLIGGFMLLISFREISDYKWISANVSQRYDTYIHQQWIFRFCIPTLLLFSIAIPLYLLIGLYQNKSKFNRKLVRQSWGYLYIEYRNIAYYWEIVKIFQRELIILSLTYFEDSILIKAIIVILILILYLELNKKFKPYNVNYLNELDYFLTNTCITSINLGIGCYFSQSSGSTVISYIFIIILLCLNIYSISYLLSKIIKEFLRQQINDLEQKLNALKMKIARFLPCLMKFKIISKILKNHKVKKERQKYLIKKLKSYLLRVAKQIIILKNQKKYNFYQSDNHCEQFIDSRTITPIISSSEKNLCQHHLVKTNSLIVLQQQRVSIQIIDQKPTMQFNINVNDTISGRQN